ncbi:hypothetical protein CJU89_4319 [Yarrowia sp. B02]|nr:hypothetical protein CJU89_4319 [Yarrowia sp. B02]
MLPRFPQDILYHLCSFLDCTSLLTLTQVCHQLRSDIGDRQFEDVLMIQNPLFHLKFTHRTSWHKCLLAQGFRDNEDVIDSDPFSNQPVTIRFLPVVRDKLIPPNFVGIGRRDRDNDPDEDMDELERRCWDLRELLREGQATDTRFLERRHGEHYRTLTSRFGLQVDAGDFDFLFVATPEILAIMRESTPPSKLHITYADQPNRSYISFMDGTRSESYQLFAVGHVVILRLVPDADETPQESFIYNYKGRVETLFKRPYHPSTDTSEFIIYDGYIWEISRQRTRSRVVIQTVTQTNQPKNIIPYVRYMEEPHPVIQDRSDPRYLLVFGHGEAKYLVDMAIKKVYSWMDMFSDPEDRTLIGDMDGQLVAFVYSNGFRANLRDNVVEIDPYFYLN